MDGDEGAARAILRLDADPDAILARLGSDPLLGPSVRAAPGRRIPGHPDPAELAVRALLGQQISVAAARTLAGRLVAAVGEPLERPGGRHHASLPDTGGAGGAGPGDAADAARPGAGARGDGGEAVRHAPAGGRAVDGGVRRAALRRRRRVPAHRPRRQARARRARRGPVRVLPSSPRRGARSGRSRSRICGQRRLGREAREPAGSLGRILPRCRHTTPGQDGGRQSGPNPTPTQPPLPSASSPPPRARDVAVERRDPRDLGLHRVPLPPLRHPPPQPRHVGRRQRRGQLADVVEGDAHALLAQHPPQRAVLQRDHRQPAAEVLVELVGQRGVQVGGVEAGVEARPAEVVGRELAQQGGRRQRVVDADARDLAVLRHVARRCRRRARSPARRSRANSSRRS